MHILVIELICDSQVSQKNKFSQAAIITAAVAAVPTARSMGFGGVPHLHVFLGKGSSCVGF